MSATPLNEQLAQKLRRTTALLTLLLLVLAVQAALFGVRLFQRESASRAVDQGELELLSAEIERLRALVEERLTITPRAFHWPTPGPDLNRSVSAAKPETEPTPDLRWEEVQAKLDQLRLDLVDSPEARASTGTRAEAPARPDPTGELRRLEQLLRELQRAPRNDPTSVLLNIESMVQDIKTHLDNRERGREPAPGRPAYRSPLRQVEESAVTPGAPPPTRPTLPPTALPRREAAPTAPPTRPPFSPTATIRRPPTLTPRPSPTPLPRHLVPQAGN
jgi:hypothetical protein